MRSKARNSWMMIEWEGIETHTHNGSKNSPVNAVFVARVF